MHKRKLRTDKIFDENFTGMMLYAQSKQVVMLLLDDMADGGLTVKFLAVNPSANKTKMTTGDETPAMIKFLARSLQAAR